MTTCPENVMVASLPHGGNMEVVGCRQSTCIAAVVATGNYRHLYPTFSICEGLPTSMPVLQRQYINPLRRNIECQSTSAFHLGLNLCWKFASPLHQPTTCNSTPNTFIANHFFPTLFSTLFFLREMANVLARICTYICTLYTRFQCVWSGGRCSRGWEESDWKELGTYLSRIIYL